MLCTCVLKYFFHNHLPLTIDLTGLKTAIVLMLCLFPAKSAFDVKYILYFFGILQTCHDFFITVNMHLKVTFMDVFIYHIVIRVRYINYVSRCVASIYMNNETYFMK